MKKLKDYKIRIYEIIEKNEEDDIASSIFDYFIVVLILLNVLAIILESYNSIYERYYFEFRVFEVISVLIFTLEYLLRIWTSDIKYLNDKVHYSRLKFLVSPVALIDLFAILPFYLAMLIPFDLRFIRLLRIIKLFRVFKLNRYSDSLKLVGKVLKKKKSELFITVLITLILILFAATLMYYAENSAQPEVFPNIIASLWCAITTLTTVGYGDVYPITSLGKIMSGIMHTQV